MKLTLEICANSVQSALNAEQAGAHRVELCDNLWEAGTTPSAATIKVARQRLSIGLFVLIRPRGGDFCYSELELEVMLEDIRMARELGADGFVSGVLNPDRTVNREYTTRLVEQSGPLPFTFHRAFDVSADWQESLEVLKSCGVTRLLTSGCSPTALEGLPVIAELMKRSDGVVIMPGGGINENNAQLIRASGCREIHLSGSTVRASPVAQPAAVKLNGTADIPEDDYKESSVDRIRQVLGKLET